MQGTSPHIQKAVSELQKHMLLYGYKLVETPIIEDAELFLTKAGDPLVSRLFTFERRGQLLALRPEFTASAAKHYVAHHENIVRWQFNGPIFEDNPEDVGYSYQRYSMGAELVGMTGAAADAEIIAMSALGIAAQQIENWQLIIGHVGLMRHLLSHYQLDSRIERFLLNHRAVLTKATNGKQEVLEKLQALLATGDEKDNAHDTDHAFADTTRDILTTLLEGNRSELTMGGRTREDIARRLLQKRARSANKDQIISAVDFLAAWGQIDDAPNAAFKHIASFIRDEDAVARQYFTEWKQVVDLLTLYDVSASHIRLQPQLARSWDYYTGIVFELRAKDGQQIGGGGRYDELVQLVSNQENVPAVGFAYYIDELIRYLPATTPGNHHEPCIQLLMTPTAQHSATLWGKMLRSHGIPVTLIPDKEGVSNECITLIALESGAIRFEQTTYQTDDMDLLLSQLRQINPQ